MVHQAAKMKEEDKDGYLDWLWKLEFEIYKLPIPDCVLFLDVPPECSAELMKGRQNKITGGMVKDIHERNREYLIDSYNNSLYVAMKYDWNVVKCTNKSGIRSVEDIHNEIYNIVVKEL